MIAFILVQFPANQTKEVLDMLSSLREPGVDIIEALPVYGDFDLILKAEVESNQALDRLVMERLQSIDQVRSTRTYVAVELESFLFKPATS